MAEYIERSAGVSILRAKANMAVLMDAAPYFEKAAQMLEKLPAADVAPVVHGRWEWFDEETGTPSTGYEREWGWRCSHCGEELPDDYDDPDDSPAFRFCYNCGAKMDGKESANADDHD